MDKVNALLKEVLDRCPAPSKKWGPTRSQNEPEGEALTTAWTFQYLQLGLPRVKTHKKLPVVCKVSSLWYLVIVTSKDGDNIWSKWQMTSDIRPLRRWHSAECLESEVYFNLPSKPCISYVLAWFCKQVHFSACAHTDTHTQTYTHPSGCCTYSHVRFATRINCFSNRVHQVAADSKITHLHLAQSINEHIRRLDIWKQEWQIHFSTTRGL